MASNTVTHLTPGARLAIMLQISLAMCSAIMTLACIVTISTELIRKSRSYRLYDRANQSSQIVLGIFCSDLLTASGFMLSLQWVTNWTVNGGGGASLCTPQAVLVHIGSLLNSVCVSALAVHTAHCMIHDKLVARDAYFALALLGLIVVAAPLAIAAGTAMWGNSGFWCQLSPKYLTFRFLLLYLPLSLAILFTTVNYARLRSYLWHTNEDMVRSVVGKERRDTVRSYRQEAKRNAKRLRILILYPLLYILTVIVEASARGFGWANEVLESQKHAEKDALDAQDWALLVGGCFLASKGAVDVLLYTMTRDIFHISADPEEQRVTSSSYASVELPEMRDEEVQHWAQQRGIDIPSGSWEETWEHPQLTPAQEGEETNRGRAPRR